MITPYQSQFAARAVWLVFCATLPVLILAAPFLATHSHPIVAAVIYIFFAPVCHQDAGRSFTMDGCIWAVCHRCSGIYLGLFFASLLPTCFRAEHEPSRVLRIWVIGASAPLLIDSLLPSTGLWTNTSWSRFGSGLIFGAMLSTLLLRALAGLQARGGRPRKHSHA